ncbi:hypothetical protein [Microbacterium gorillae]|uniref:hypothetical protein n=1 Tax=Microbacterium gorillae TaxID=1231063 RepID=UPI000A7BE33D|nr:hypothetical protein [Microbacterium gorillae]
MGLIRGYDPETLRELIDPRECEQRLEEIGAQRSLPDLMERVWLLKVLGRFDEALTVSEQSVRQARMGGTRKDLLRARVLHASVVHSRGGSIAAEQELTTCMAEGEGQGWPAIAAFAAQHRGRVHYDNGDFHSARRDFKHALFLRQQSGASEDDLESTLMAVDSADQRWAHESAQAHESVSGDVASEPADLVEAAERAARP